MARSATGAVLSAVWKFALRIDDQQTAIMPQGAELLHVGAQRGQLMLWARVIPTGQPLVRRTILVRGTGDLVWHVFDGGEGE